MSKNRHLHLVPVSASHPLPAAPPTPPPSSAEAAELQSRKEKITYLRTSPTRRERVTYTYEVLPLSPDAWRPEKPCATCGGRSWVTYYWVSWQSHDEQGRPKPVSPAGWACASCSAPLPDSKVAKIKI